MWKLILLVAVLANLETVFGNQFLDRITRTMNEAINSRFSCNDFVTDEYSEDCSEVQSGYNISELNKQYCEANCGLAGVCIYQLSRTVENEDQLTSVSALVHLMSQLTLNTLNMTRTQLYNIINFNNNEEVRYMIPKMVDEHAQTSGDFVSILKTVAFARSDNDFTEHFKSCMGQIAKGETKAVDFSSPAKAASEINAWFNAKSSYYDEVVAAEDIADDTVMMTGSHHHVEISFKNFIFKEQVERDFIIAKDKTIAKKVWVGEGLGKVSYNRNLDATVLELALKGDRQLVIIQPKLGGMKDTLFKARNSCIVTDLNAETQWEYIKVYIPIYEDNYGKENYVDGLKMANQVSNMYFEGFDDFYGIFENQSGHLSYMFHTMYLKIHGLRAANNFLALKDLVTPKKIVNINSAFAYYIINPSGTPEMIGTYFGLNN